MALACCFRSSLALLIGAILLVAAGCAAGEDGPTPASSPDAQATVTVTGTFPTALPSTHGLTPEQQAWVALWVSQNLSIPAEDLQWILSEQIQLIGQSAVQIALTADSLDVTSAVNKDAAIELSRQTEMLDDDVDDLRLLLSSMSVHLEEIKERVSATPVTLPRELTHEEYCVWLKAGLDKARETEGDGIGAYTAGLVAISFNC